VQLQPQLASEKRGIHAAHPRLPEASAALRRRQRKFVAILFQTIPHRRFDGGDIGVCQSFFPTAKRVDLLFPAFFAKLRVRFRQAA
jgi:hypothetical protein